MRRASVWIPLLGVCALVVAGVVRWASSATHAEVTMPGPAAAGEAELAEGPRAPAAGRAAARRPATSQRVEGSEPASDPARAASTERRIDGASSKGRRRALPVSLMPWSEQLERAPANADLGQDHGAALHGRVVDPDGAPLPGVAVLLGPASSDRGSFERVVCRSDPSGYFRIDGVAPARYDLLARAVGDEHAQSERREITVVAGEVREVELRLRRPVTLRGRVLTFDGDPIASARVEVTSSGRPDRRGAITDADGGFELRGLEPLEDLVATAAVGPLLSAGTNAPAGLGVRADMRAALEPSLPISAVEDTIFMVELRAEPFDPVHVRGTLRVAGARRTVVFVLEERDVGFVLACDEGGVFEGWLPRPGEYAVELSWEVDGRERRSRESLRVPDQEQWRIDFEAAALGGSWYGD